MKKMMDISCPAELVGFERADFGEERRQAYLIFLNESPHVITAISGRLILQDEKGTMTDDQRVSFGQIRARPGERFTCHLELDEAPSFVDADVIIEDVVFDGEEPWALHPLRLKDYTPPALEEGPARNALLAVAGHDAVCYPAHVGDTWLCVCGRYNRWRWFACRRCRRERNATLEQYTPELVKESYDAIIEQEKREPPAVLVGDDRPRKKRAPAKRGNRFWARVRWGYVIGAVAAVAVIAVLAVMLLRWFPTRLEGNQPSESTAGPVAGQTQVPAYAPDYLDPIR